MKKKLVLTAAAIAIAGGWILFATLAADKRAPTRFLLDVARIADIVVTISATGKLDAVSTVDVSSQLSGQIAEVYVDFNDEVVRDQPLAKLDQAGFLAEVREALAELIMIQASVTVKMARVKRARFSLEAARAKAEVYTANVKSAAAESEEAQRVSERKITLRKKGNVSQSEVDRSRSIQIVAAASLDAAKAEATEYQSEIAIAVSDLNIAIAELDMARAAIPQKEAALERAKVDLHRSIIRAPFNGIVIKRDVDSGQTVAASLEAPTLFMLAEDLRKTEVLVSVDEADIGLIKVGQRVEFQVDAFPGHVFSGRVRQVRKAPEEKQNVVTYTVVITANNEKLQLFPGMTAIVDIIIHSNEKILTVPNAALRLNPSEIAGGVRLFILLPELAASEHSEAGVSQTIWTLGPEGEPSAVRVTTGATDGLRTEILDGDLTAGQKVIIGRDLPEERRGFFETWLGL